MRGLHAGQDGFGAVIVEAHSIDCGAVWSKSEQAWFGVARLRPWCDATDLHEPDPEPSYPGNRAGVLVKTGRDGDRIGKMQTANVLCQRGKVVGACPGAEAGCQSTQGEAVSRFSRKKAQRGAADLVKCAHVARNLSQVGALEKPGC